MDIHFFQLLKQAGKEFLRVFDNVRIGRRQVLVRCRAITRRQDNPMILRQIAQAEELVVFKPR